MTTSVCPLCQKTGKTKRTKTLYGTPVCRKCYYRFANQRQLAYIVDWMLWTAITFGVPSGWMRCW